jgi:protein-L-isoaspartate(D-aspartate) O-methyltransferase
MATALLVLVPGIAIGGAEMTAADATRAAERRRMVEEVRAAFAGLGRESGVAAADERVLAALGAVLRHAFVPEELAVSAYRNRPLPIGLGQTISQPFIVALMTQLLNVGPESRVLEVGTGSGYQSAVLARLVAHVYSIEIVEPLGRQAAATLARLGVGNVTTRIGDGYLGWPEAAPFDAIIVTAAPDHVPPALVEQLAPGGRLVIPVGGVDQDLTVVEKSADGSTHSTSIVPVRFVPLTRDKTRPRSGP